MEIKVTEQLRVELQLPVLEVEDFRLEWKTNCHACLLLHAYIKNGSSYHMESLYDSRVRVWEEKEGSTDTYFCGYIFRVEETAAGDTKKICLEARSGSIRLDWKRESRSCQNVGKSYAEIIRETAESAGGQTICTAGTDRAIERPVIRYEETAWEFARRLASHLGTCVIADNETGNPSFWFGMRNGRKTGPFAEEEYRVTLKKDARSGRMECSYETESRDFYRLGDWTSYLGRKLTVCGVSGTFTRGELVFRYLLKSEVHCSMLYQEKFAGLGLAGRVEEVCQEKLRVALDIDGGVPTGSYFYDWYPETGNALYAMPEPGARILLYFGSRDEREGFLVRSFPNDIERGSYKGRRFNPAGGNSVHLSDGSVNVSRGGKSLTLSDGFVSAASGQNLSISARDQVSISADRIRISTPDELTICQG